MIWGILLLVSVFAALYALVWVSEHALERTFRWNDDGRYY